MYEVRIEQLNELLILDSDLRGAESEVTISTDQHSSAISTGAAAKTLGSISTFPSGQRRQITH